MSLTQEQLKDRLNYIGGSDAAGVLGLSRWATPLSVWAEKTGQIVRPPLDSEAAELGEYLEEYVARRFTKETGKKVHRVNETIFHPKYSFLGANLDRRVVGEDAILECKTASAWKSKEWQGEEIPREYILQCYHYLLVTGKQRCYLAVLIGNQDFHWKVIERDEQFVGDMLKREVEFWSDYVITDIMPSVITKYDADTLEALYPQAEEGKEIILSDEANQLIENLSGLKADLKNVEDLIDEHENKLKALLGDAVRGTTSLHVVQWSNSTYSNLDRESFKKDLPKLYAQYYKSKPTRRFTYKKIQAIEKLIKEKTK